MLRHVFLIACVVAGCFGEQPGNEQPPPIGNGGTDAGLPDAGGRDPVALKIISWNVRDLFDEQDDPAKQDEVKDAGVVGTKLTNIANVLNPIAADVLALQEVENAAMLARLANALSGGYPHRILYEGNDPRGIDVALASKFPITFSRTHIYDTFTAPGGTTVYRYSRDCLEVHLDVVGRKVIVLVNHQLSQLSGGDEQRRAQAAQTRKIADALRAEDPQRTVLVTGDMNDDVTAPSTAIYVGDGAYVDIGIDVPSADRYTYVYLSTRRRYDYIFPDKDSAPWRTSVQIPHSTSISAVSDHAPVIATFSLP